MLSGQKLGKGGLPRAGQFGGDVQTLRGRARPSPVRAMLQDWRRKNRVSGTSADQQHQQQKPEGVPTRLRLFLDSASATQHDLWFSTGLFHGITTNPTILQRDGVKCNIKSLTQLARAGFEAGAQEVHLQAWGDSVQKLSSIAFDLAGVDPNRIVVKLPCTLEGTQTAALLRESNIRVTLTGLYAAPQVLVGQAVGAEYAAPYLGRMNDAYGGDQGEKAVVEMQRILDSNQSRMRLLVASIRDSAEMTRLAAAGCNTFTITPTLAAKLFNNPYTIDAAADFEAAAKANGADEEPPRNLTLSAAWATARSRDGGSGAPTRSVDDASPSSKSS